MNHSPLDLPATPARLRALAGAGLLEAPALEAALAAIGRRPSPAGWRAFSRFYLLVLGVVLLGVGVVFFFAANWHGLDAFARMGVIAMTIAASAGFAAWLGLERLAARMSVLLSAILIGPLLAVYGQTYQTGADTWTLFLAWALLVTPFAVIARSGGLWFFWLALVNGATGLWWMELEFNIFGKTSGVLSILIGLAGLNAAALTVWEAGRARGLDWLLGRTVPRMIAMLALAPLIAPASASLAGLGEAVGSDLEQVTALLLTVGALVALVALYRRVVPDLFMLALAAGGACWLVSLALARLLFHNWDLELGGLFLLGFAVLAQVWAVARWLLRWRQDPAHASEPEVPASDAGGEVI